jgi:hypothetical protein
VILYEFTTPLKIRPICNYTEQGAANVAEPMDEEIQPGGGGLELQTTYSASLCHCASLAFLDSRNNKHFFAEITVMSLK